MSRTVTDISSARLLVNMTQEKKTCSSVLLNVTGSSSVSQVVISQFRTVGKFLFSFFGRFDTMEKYFVATSFGRSLC